jgi:CHASE2 domain-containing sensor protein
MRIAAGVLLIIAAIMNVMAGAGYAFVGAAGDAIMDVADKAVDAAAKTDGVKVNESAKADMAKAKADVKGMTGGLKYFGFFLLLVFVLQIVGAIFCFIRKSPMFIMIVAILTIAAEVGGAVMSSFGLANIIGLVAGVLAFLAAMGLKKGDAPAAPAAPAA